MPESPIQELIPLLLDVESNLDQDLTLDSLARQFGYSPFHFHRVFSGALGETPKQHVDRLRLERAAYKLAISDLSVLDIALSVGFRSHETFSRAFKRAFDYTPKDYRRACKGAQARRLERNREFRGDGCLLSDVRFISLPATPLLAIRRLGAYDEMPTPFTKDDVLFTRMVESATRHKIPHRPLPLVISYDDPTVTPRSLQRLDACIPINDGDVHPEGDIRRLDFPGGRFGGIEHAGPLSTIPQAYSNLADGIRRSPRYQFDQGPPVEIFRKIHIGGDPDANLTEVYFPLRKKRQEPGEARA